MLPHQVITGRLEEKWILKNYLSNRNYFCLIMRFIFIFCFMKLKNIIALQKTSVVALDTEY